MSQGWEANSGFDVHFSAQTPLGKSRMSIHPSRAGMASLHATEDLHAWSLYRQNLNSDFTDSGIGSRGDRTPLPYGHFQLRESTVQSILSNPRYGPKSELGSNMRDYMRFGLPRVFPPTIFRPREVSSGYDSSEDGMTPMHSRSKSQPDLLAHREWGAGIMHGNSRLKSSSEANLLATEALAGHRRPHKMGGSQMSLLSRHSKRSRSRLHGAVFSQPMGGAGPCREPPMLNDKLFPRDAHWVDEEAGLPPKGPHLQVRNLVLEMPGKTPLLDGISVEVRAGDLFGLMATSEIEGTCFLDVLGGHGHRWEGSMRGDFILNGCLIKPSQLASRAAYVQQDVNFCPDMSVRQTLLLHAFFREAGDASRVRNVIAKINALIEDLGLEQVRHTRVKSLTLSEKRRLNVACHLLLETDVVLLDQPTRGMDIFDTFFLVEYLRQWAARGRIVIATLQPPTYEIFMMLSRVALVSTGRLMYFGRRREMLPYFAFIDHPCPAFKNPADYYVDLVTLDDLTSEAMLESSQRIEKLAETFRRRQEPLSDPGPPGPLPPKVIKANPCIELFGLWMRALIYQFPYNMILWLWVLIISTFMSVAIGAVFWDVRSSEDQEQDGLNNRISFFYVIAVVGIWPTVLMAISEVWRERPSVIRDVDDGLYSNTVYVITKTLYSALPSLLIFLAYVMPAYAMAGFQNHDDLTIFYLYLGYTVIYLFAVRAFALASAAFFQSRHVAASAIGLLMSVVALGAGYVVHPKDMSSWTRHTALWSPVRWFLTEMSSHELNSDEDVFDCKRNPTFSDRELRIEIRTFCGIKTGNQALRFLDLEKDPAIESFWPIVVLFIAYAIGQILYVVSSILRSGRRTHKNYKVD